MAVFLSNGAVVTLNSVDISAYVTGVTINRSFDELEITAMGDTAHKFVKGLEASTITLDLLNNDAASGSGAVTATLQAAFGTTVPLTIKRTSAAINSEEMKQESMSAEQVESIVNAKMSSFSTAVEAIGEMMQTIASDNETLRTEMAAMKNDFESFKAMPSNSTTEGEKFARVNSTLTSRQLFLKSQIK